MENRADHADNEERHARVMDLFLVTLDHRLIRVQGLIVSLSLTASVALVRETRQQPVSVRSRPGRLLLVRIWCQLLAVRTARRVCQASTGRARWSVSPLLSTKVKLLPVRAMLTSVSVKSTATVSDRLVFIGSSE